MCNSDKFKASLTNSVMTFLKSKNIVDKKAVK